IHRRQHVEAVARQHFRQMILEILHPLVEFPHSLYRRWQPPMPPGISNETRRLAKGGDHRHFRLANLETKEPAPEHHNQKYGDNKESQGIAIHYVYFLAGGTVTFIRS